MTRRRRKQPYRSGYCTFAKHQYPCKGEFENGAAVKPRTVICSCECHGDYEERLRLAGQEFPTEAVDEEDE